MRLAPLHDSRATQNFAGIRHYHAVGLITSVAEESFETAADAVIEGRLTELRALLRTHPALATARSHREHHATLLHYVAANGVEQYRQKSPPNAVEIANALLEAGAEVDALADTYAGGTTETTLNLLVSSVHPRDAGVQVPLVHTLLDHGAAIDGIANDCSPLVTALAFWYGSAAAALVERGARVDTVATAAGMGRLDLVREMVAADGTVRDGVRLLDVPWLRLGNDAQANLEVAAVWARIHGHPEVEAYLVHLGVNARARNNWGKPVGA
jgi:hypothetical protein